MCSFVHRTDSNSVPCGFSLSLHSGCFLVRCWEWPAGCFGQLQHPPERQPVASGSSRTQRQRGLASTGWTSCGCAEGAGWRTLPPTAQQPAVHRWAVWTSSLCGTALHFSLLHISSLLPWHVSNIAALLSCTLPPSLSGELQFRLMLLCSLNSAASSLDFRLLFSCSLVPAEELYLSHTLTSVVTMKRFTVQSYLWYLKDLLCSSSPSWYSVTPSGQFSFVSV